MARRVRQRGTDEPKGLQTIREYDDHLGVIATKISGSFLGLTVFFAIVAYGDGASFAVIASLQDKWMLRDSGSYETTALFFLWAILAHHFRVFAGVSFIDFDTNLAEKLSTMRRGRQVSLVIRWLLAVFIISA